jgi:tripartite-type tricarboxylate transporter receptor subunit TctC
MKAALRCLLLPLILALTGVTAGAQKAGAQTWPERPVRVIVSTAAGATPDIICRIVTERLSRALGQQVVVENRPGGANVIGAQAAARSAADGYTFFFATAAALVTNPYTFKALPYDPLKDFVVMAKVVEGPFVVLAHPGVAAKTLPEVIALAKAEPGKLSFATDGPRNFSGMIAAWLNKLGGTDIPQIPYSAMPQGIQDALAGRVQLIILAIPSAAGAIASGGLRPLATTMAQRVPGYEHVSTVGETFSGFDFTGWMVLAAPAGTPPAVVERVNREMDVILKDPDVVKRLREIGFFTEGAGTLKDAADYVRNQYEAWGKVVREIGLQPE